MVFWNAIADESTRAKRARSRDPTEPVACPCRWASVDARRGGSAGGRGFPRLVRKAGHRGLVVRLLSHQGIAEPRPRANLTRACGTVVERAAEQCYNPRMDAASRKAARAGWELVVRRSVPAATEEADDCAFWLRLPVDERAAATWELSREVFALAELNGGAFDAETGLRMESGALDERRLPRTAFRVSRR
jgi:hypothetical protein